MKVLVVEDEVAYRQPLTFRLRQDGMEVAEAANGPEALKVAGDFQPDVILLDLMIPGVSGTEVCRRLRENPPGGPGQVGPGIIMVTAKDEEVDKVLGLELGADDYVTKPYSYRELLARVRAVGRRREEIAALAGSPAALPALGGGGAEEILEVGPLRMDLGAHEVWVRGEEVRLPLREFRLLHYLAENAGRVLTRAQLLDEIWGLDFVGDPKTLDVHIKRLRSRLEEDPATPALILTVRGLGYKFAG